MNPICNLGREETAKGRMKTGLASIIGLLAIMATGFAASPLQAGFVEGWDAYQRGDFVTALSEWKPLAESGDARAQFNLGVLFDQGKGVPLSHVAAVHWWRRSAEAGYSSAQHNLANSLIAGDGVARDYGAAIAWLEQASNSGLAGAKYTLGKR